jgi:chaperonin GroEL
VLTRKQTPELIFQPEATNAIQRGIQTVVKALRPTLGPLSGGVAIENVNKAQKLPEFLDDGGTIARRIIELADRDEDMGAMLARSMIVKQHETIGDGTVTAAILLDAIVSAGVRYIAAGGDAMQIRRHLDRTIPLILEELERQTFALQGEQALIDMAYNICHDREMAARIGETFHLLGEFGRLEVREGYARKLKREYVQGTYYYSGVMSRVFLTSSAESRVEVQEAAVFLSDYNIEEHRDLFPILKAAHAAGVKNLLIIARNLSEKAIGLLTTNNNMNSFRAIALKLPGLNDTDRAAALEDLSLLTGAKAHLNVLGANIDHFSPDDFGYVRRAWADLRAFGVIGGRGDKRRLRSHIDRLKQLYYASKEYDQRRHLQQRIGNLLGGSATLWIGGFSETEIAAQKNVADRTVRAMRTALDQGVVIGGGLALYRCRDALKRLLTKSEDTDQRAVYGMLIEALAVPARTILTNAGYEPGTVLADLEHKNPDTAFDVETGKMVNIHHHGIYESSEVVSMALRHAVTTAGLALTIDVLIHRSNPELVGKPT